jgi:hypothetical protein
MVEDEFGPIDVTGRWIGFYCHRSELLGPFPIAAHLRQEEDRFHGEMTDEITDRSHFLETLIEAHRADHSALTRLLLGSMIRQHGEGVVEIETCLPEISEIRGRVRGGRITFAKKYRGVYEVMVFVSGNLLRTTSKEGHTVHYSGRLDPNRLKLTGQWVIRWPGWLGRILRPQARGTFELCRKA